MSVDHVLGLAQAHRDAFNAVETLAASIAASADKLTECLRRGNKILLCGNGGSAADCQHLAAEFSGRFHQDRPPLAALSLTTDTSALTCIANDYSFDDVFARQVAALGQPGDCLVGISTSGNSANVARALQTARERGLATLGLLGRDGGRCAALCDWPLVVPAQDTARIQEVHIFIGHAWCALVEHALFEQ